MVTGHRSSLVRTIPILVLSLQACGTTDAGSGDVNSEWTATTDTIGDTIRVFTEHGQIWESDARLVSEVSIGVLDGDPQYQFGNIRAIAVGADGRMYVLDGHGPVIRVYAPDGAWLQDVGREGEGPGEYKRPDSGLVMRPDGRLLLRDPGNSRISIYDSDGIYEGFWPLAGSMNTSNPMVVTRAGAALTPVIKIGRDYEPVSVTADEASIRRRQITKNFRDNFPGWSWNGPPIPDEKPPYRALLTSQEGRIWVQIHSESQRYMSTEDQRAEEARLERPVNPYREPVVFDVFEPTGEYLGRVETPDGFTIYPRPVIRDMVVWGVIKDELDVARLHRFRVEFDAKNSD